MSDVIDRSGSRSAESRATSFHASPVTGEDHHSGHVPVNASPNLVRLRDFIIAFDHLLQSTSKESEILAEGGLLLAGLVSTDDWLPDDYTQPHPQHYQQYLLYADARERFSVVSFVWGPGQQTPIHDHETWGLIGMLRGEERSQRFIQQNGHWQPSGNADHLRPGDVDRLSPSEGDVHQVSNVFSDRVSISIHVYGGNIGAITRSVFTPSGERKPFISGYSNQQIPNLWDRSHDATGEKNS